MNLQRVETCLRQLIHPHFTKEPWEIDNFFIIASTAVSSGVGDLNVYVSALPFTGFLALLNSVDKLGSQLCQHSFYEPNHWDNSKMDCAPTCKDLFFLPMSSDSQVVWHLFLLSNRSQILWEAENITWGVERGASKVEHVEHFALLPITHHRL